MFANHMDGSYMDAIDTYIVVDVARYVTWHSLRDPSPRSTRSKGIKLERHRVVDKDSMSRKFTLDVVNL